MLESREQLLNHAPCGIFSITYEGQITSANPFCCTQLEYELDELTSLNVAALLSISGRIFYQTHFFPLVKLHEHTEEIFLTLKSKSKKDVPVVLNALVHRWIDRDEIICSFIPVYNRRKYEDEILLAKKKAEEAVSKNKELERFKQELEVQQIKLDQQISLLKFQNVELLQLSRVISHDLQEPVRKLIFFSNELLNGSLDESKQEHALSVINYSSKKAKNLLLNLQDYLGLTALAVNKQTVDLAAIINNELRLLQNAYPAVEFYADIGPLPMLTGTENQLHLLFHHLLENAFIHGTKENCLHLVVSAVTVKENIFNSLEGRYLYTDYVKITVADKGHGFDPIYNEYVLDVLKRLNVKNDRLGLGLAFCKRIAENHRGNITAEGRPGNGASFVVTLPVDVI